MEIVRHRTTVIRQSYEVVRLHYDCLPRRLSCNPVRCRTTPHDHSMTSWEGRAVENMWKYGVARHRAMILRYHTISGIVSRFFSRTKNRQKVVRGSPMAATSYNIAKIRTIHTITQTSPFAGGHTMSKATVTPGLTTSYDYLRWVNCGVSGTIVRRCTTSRWSGGLVWRFGGFGHVQKPGYDSRDCRVSRDQRTTS